VRPEGIRATITEEKKIVDLRAALAVLRRVKGLSHWIDHWDRKSIFKITGKVNKKTLLRSIFPELTRRNLITLQAWECEEPSLTPSQENDCRALFDRLAESDGKINYKTIVKFVGFPVEENLHSVSDKILETLDPDKSGKIMYDGFAAYYAKAWNINFFEALVGKVENMDL
jgi:Ca2+-binding EF-hand superfamily protein